MTRITRADYAGIYPDLVKNTFRTLLRRGASYDLAAELAAAACARAVNRLGGLRDPRCLRAYVVVTAVNMLRDEVVHYQRFCPLMPKHDRATPPHANAAVISLRRALHRCGHQGELLRRRFLIGETTAEIAADFGISRDAVRHRITRALGRVRKELDVGTAFGPPGRI